MNETLRVIASRYACRCYDGRLPEKEKLDAIAMAALQSPSGMNKQPWQIVVITDKAFLEEMDADGMRALARAEDKSTYERMMDRGGTLFYNAPCMFLILKRPGADMDCGIVAQSISVAAVSLGLGCVICGMSKYRLSAKKETNSDKEHASSTGWSMEFPCWSASRKQPAHRIRRI
jgi:nitroreductase